MQITHLRYFLAVAEQRHFGRAADDSGVTQPTLSKQIRALENSLGTSLFLRMRAGVELTTAGEALLPHARRIVIESDLAERSVREVARLERGRVRLGATPSMVDGLLPSVLRSFHDQYPAIDLVIREGGSRVLTRDLLVGELDLALIIVPLPPGTGDLETTTVFRERLVVIGPPDSTMPETLDLPDLREVPLVMFREGYDLRDVTTRACNRAGFDPRVAVEGGEMGGVLRFVESGLGHAVVPEIVTRYRAGLQSSRLDNPPLQREIAIAHRAIETLPLAVRTFRDHLVNSRDLRAQRAT